MKEPRISNFYTHVIISLNMINNPKAIIVIAFAIMIKGGLMVISALSDHHADALISKSKSVVDICGA